MEPVFFETPAELRRWLARHHAAKHELLVGIWKKGTGRRSITWPELVEELLCYGWIDGIRRSRDAESYTIRATPRRPRSHWSLVNVRLAEKLIADRRMRAAGRAAFDARTKTEKVSFSDQRVAFDAKLAKRFRARKRAWAWWRSQPPGYRKAATWYVMGAQREDTRERRFRQVLEHAARGERIPPLARPAKGR